MKILFDNVIENNSGIVASNESLNYPVEQIVHPFLQLRFQSLTDTSLITVSFDEDQTMDCFFWAYHNATSMVLVFKDSTDAILNTINIATEATTQANSIKFTELSTVRKIELTITGSTGVFLGGIGAGCCYEMPNFLSEYTIINHDNSTIDESDHGQSLQNYVKPLRGFGFSFSSLTEAIIKEINSKYVSVGIGKPLYIDLFEENHDKEEPLYGKILTALTYTQGRISLSFPLSIKECR